MKLMIVVSALASLLVFSAAHAEGDAGAGKSVFAKCAICHSPQPGKTLLGPSLFGVGRPSATVPGFAYSEAMKKVGKTWDEATLDAYLADPKGMVPGTKMTFAGLPKPEDRANVIAYLATLK